LTSCEIKRKAKEGMIRKDFKKSNLKNNVWKAISCAIAVAFAFQLTGCVDTTLDRGDSSTDSSSNDAASSSTSGASSEDSANADASTENLSSDDAINTSTSNSVISINTEDYQLTYCTDDGYAVSYAKTKKLSVTDTKHEALANAISQISDYLVSTVESDIEELGEMAEDEYEALGSNNMYANDVYNQYFIEMVPYIIRCDEDVTSILVSVTQNQGGVHQETSYETFNFDTDSGKRIDMDAVTSDKDSLAGKIANYLWENYDSNIFLEATNEEELKSDVLNIMNTEDEDGSLDTKEGGINFTIGYDDVTFYFSNYEIAAYAGGCQYVSLLFDDNSDVLDGSFKSNVSGYVIPIMFGNTYNYTLADGTKGQYTAIQEYLDEEDMYDFGVNFSADDESQNDALYTLEASYVRSINDEDLYFAKNDDKSYILLGTQVENDYGTIHIFDISSIDNTTEDNVKSIGRYFGSVPMNPKDMLLEGIGDAISTVKYFSSFAISDDGDFKANGEYDYIDDISSDNILTLKQDIEAEIVSDDTGITADGDNTNEKISLSSGDEFTLYRIPISDTSEHDFVDMKTSDGKIVRFYMEYDLDNYKTYVNGILTDDLFDNIFLAG